MIKYLKTFFYPPISTYSYNLRRELAIEIITGIFKKKVTLLGSKDISGSFLNKDTFVIDIISIGYSTGGIKYSSTLVGEVIKSENEKTVIHTRAKPSYILYFFFFFAIFLGLLYLYKFIKDGDWGFLFWSKAMLFIGPAFVIGFSKAAISAIQERYKMYIDKELKA